MLVTRCSVFQEPALVPSFSAEPETDMEKVSLLFCTDVLSCWKNVTFKLPKIYGSLHNFNFLYVQNQSLSSIFIVSFMANT